MSVKMIQLKKMVVKRHAMKKNWIGKAVQTGRRHRPTGVPGGGDDCPQHGEEDGKCQIKHKLPKKINRRQAMKTKMKMEKDMVNNC
jgi:hypothetical protein